MVLEVDDHRFSARLVLVVIHSVIQHKGSRKLSYSWIKPRCGFAKQL